MSKRALLQREAPVNYVAGLGRGATGFTTRSDIGPARVPSDPTFGKPPPDYVAGRGRGASAFSKEPDDEGPEKQVLDDDDAGLFAGTAYDADDKEADEIWDAIDERMDSRRKARREALEAKKVQQMRKERPKITAQMASLKAELKKVTAEEWEAIQDPGDHSLRNKRQRLDRYTPTPSTLLEQVQRESQYNTTIDLNGYATSVNSGYVTSSPSVVTPSSVINDLTMVGRTKKTIMQAKLAQASDSVSGQTSINPKGYLTDLNAIKISTAAEVGDIKRARVLFDSVCKANPTNAPGWIARARLEESDGKLAAARKIICKAFVHCPKSQDVWLEAARLHDPEEAKTILANAVREIPNSVQLWLAAAGLEEDKKRKKRVLRKALEIIPTSPKLWRAAVELEEPSEARVMLAHAVECIPTSMEMWLALAKLETYENAKKVLNKACKRIPTEKAIWIAAAQLQEANGNVEGAQNVIRKAVKSLAAHGVQIDRDQWMKEAETCEKANSVVTCRSIIQETVGQDIDKEDRKNTWCEDADGALARDSIETARAIYDHACGVFPGKKSLWLRRAQMEKRYGDAASLEAVLSKAVRYCRQSEVLWLMYAKHKWLQGDVEKARSILEDAFGSLPGNEQIYLAAVKLEKENGKIELARAVLQNARKKAPTERVWMKSALLERECHNFKAERELLESGIKQFPKFAKMYLMLGQHKERENHLIEARTIYMDGLSHCTDSVPLWISLSRVEEQLEGLSRARAILETARIKIPMSPMLWLEGVRLEARKGEIKSAFNMLAKALQECPKSGILWAEIIDMEKASAKNARSLDALKRCDQDPHVMLAVARLFWMNHQIEKARLWFKRFAHVLPSCNLFF
eukprot:TRINITY_DN5154_c0_g3_i1.p1 TRINITY_DN5154_c0_g3~~TRINITY_DN5154_c0_g3_i1.p1  ORF type:complete len:862 (-),score=175.28 TRINITY_DN5154_c0_g3_i1:403-2988(-)